MPWWGWIIVGAILLGSELMGIDAAFYLMFIGFAAIVTGLLELAGLQLEPWIQWLVFATLAIGSMVTFRRRLYTKFRGVAVDYDDGPVGKRLQMQQKLEPGNSCRMKFRGSSWTVFNDGATTIEKGANVNIKSVDGLTLHVSNSDPA